MRDPKTIRLLLVEDNIEDERVLREAINEIEEAPHWPNWHICETVSVGCLYDALGVFELGRFDAVLLNLTLPDTETLLQTFAQVQAASRNAPVLVLADEEDESLAHTLLRDGAQDVLIKAELNCSYLARSIRYAIERQRRTNTLESVSFFDELTGLYNDRGFAAFAGHDIQLARSMGRALLFAVVELCGPPAWEGGDMVLIQAADLLRNSFAGASIIGRISSTSFAVCTTLYTEGGFEQAINGFERELESGRGNALLPITVRAGSSTYNPGHSGDFFDLLQEAESRLAPKLAMLAH